MPSPSFAKENDDDSSSPQILLRPEECLLSPDPSRPDMPVVQLPRLLLKRLVSSHVAKALVWGTRAPAPPVERLQELVGEVSKMASVASNDNTVAIELASIWTTIARAHLRDDGIGAKDKAKLRAICSREDSHCLPVRLSPLSSTGGDSMHSVVPVGRCILLQSSSNNDNGDRDRLKSLTAESFVATGFMYDFNDVKSNPFFSSPEISRAVIELSGIPSVASASVLTLRKTSGKLLRHVWNTEPIIHRSSPLRAAFTYAMKWYMEMPTALPNKNDGGIKLFVKRGPGFGSRALPARWVPISGGSITPVLDDDKTRSRVSLLSPDMGVQLLGVLDHFDNERDCPNARILASIDRDAIAFCNVLRLSDKRFVVKTKASGAPKVVDGAPPKLQLVFALLKAMEAERVEAEGSSLPSASSTRDFLDPTHEPPILVKHESLSREFQAPVMNSAVRLYAVWGRAPTQISTKRCILASGDADDYSVELEQLVLNHVGIRLSPMLASSREYRAALRLLSHLESNTSFDKFVRRDFNDSDVVARWKRLLERSKAIGALRTAEKGRDADALRNALMVAEEACEDDEDGGDSILKTARELLPKLEEVARVRKEADERRIAEEQEKEAVRLAAIREEKEAFERWKEEEKEKALARLASKDGGGAQASHSTGATAPPSSAGPDSSRGRGRGLLLPAWMTSADALEPSGSVSAGRVDDALAGGDIATKENEQAMEEAKSLVSSIMGEAGGTCAETGKTPPHEPAVPKDFGVVGRGRGISNAPAWMAKLGDGSSTEPAEVVASITPKTAAAAAPAAAAGRDRGNISNLPAWMASASGTGAQSSTSAAQNKDGEFADADEASAAKRGVQEEADGDGDAANTRPSKKAKIELKSFEFSLKVQLEPSKLPDFVASARSKVQERAQSHGGSATLERIDP
mmetsp:Transcript_24344/g.50200  ORF Transcript_24344/g.50200 Transcript_24344/m.50200 type:complete len:920 (-) Transcript_24344:275-3034(-)